MFRKFVILSLDGLGIGALPDVSSVRREDIGANSFKHVYERYPLMKIPHLRSLGLEDSLSLGERTGRVKGEFLYTVAKSKYIGVDDFLAHQEILGSKPKKLTPHPFASSMEEIGKLLVANGLSVLRYRADEDKTAGVLIVNNGIIIGDEIDFDVGHSIRLTALFDIIPFNVVLDIAKLIRSHVKNECVTVCGTTGIELKILFKGYQTKEARYAGISVPLSRIHNENFKILHLGNHVNYKNQITHKLLEVGVKSTIIGSYAEAGDNITCINATDMDDICSNLKESIAQHDSRFILANISDLTLAGRAKDIRLYANILEGIDVIVGKLMEAIEGNSILVVMGSHGADPLVQYQKYTREYVPVLIHSKEITYGSFAARDSLADVSATAADYFNAKKPEAGDSFYSLMF